MRQALVIAAMALALTGCKFDRSSLDEALCEDDAGCPEGKVCQDGLCVDDAGGEPCGGTCTEDEHCCDETCVDLSSDDANCGSCGNGCGEGERCCAGVCTNVSSELANCGDCGALCTRDACEEGVCRCRDPNKTDCTQLTGCETEILVDPNNCGGCGILCADPAKPICLGGVCSCGAQACTSSEACCPLGDGDYECAELAQTIGHCGACDIRCGAGADRCEAGDCRCGAREACAEGFCLDGDCETNCGGKDCGSGEFCCGPVGGRVCVDTLTSPDHCGTCGNACVGGTACADGSCRCSAGLTSCPAGCADIASDKLNCGQCGLTCAGDCVDGQCTCDGEPVDLRVDPYHCGSCTNACTGENALGACTSGACGPLACFAGFGNCDASPDGSCETALDTAEHCGGCGIVCESGLCANGSCVEGDVVVDLALGENFSCALRADGTVWCWGVKTEGRTGVGCTNNAVTVPTQLTELSDIVDIESGWKHSCALSRTGKVWCWGKNNRGQIGNGVAGDACTPQPVVGADEEGQLGDIAAIATGSEHSCALASNNDLYCWGHNDKDQVGIAIDHPWLVPDRKARLVACGADHTVILQTDLRLAAWGDPANARLGDDSILNAARLAGGKTHNCALELTQPPRVVCWGQGTECRLGETTQDSEAPLPVDGLDCTLGTLDVGVAHACAGCTDQTAVYCWGKNDVAQVVPPAAAGGHPPALRSLGTAGSITAVGAGNNHSCAAVGAEVYCWGDNAEGELGNSSGASLEPMPVVFP